MPSRLRKNKKMEIMEVLIDKDTKEIQKEDMDEEDKEDRRWRKTTYLLQLCRTRPRVAIMYQTTRIMHVLT
jgi:hypothetical protein